MTRRRMIAGVLHNFLGTFTSRYSDFTGYWLFGFLVEAIGGLNIDLLDTNESNSEYSASAFARQLAARKFSEQISKARVPRTWFREARLELSRPAEPRIGSVNGRSISGYAVSLTVHVGTDLGRTYASAATMFVAPHDPSLESRSTRADFR
jgi:hypothetical protein